MRSLWLGLLLSSRLALAADSPSLSPSPAFLLPDQSRIALEAEPPLSHKKLSRLQLKPSATGPWTPIAFDAEMPAHKHGMVVVPTIPERKGEAFEVRGIKLHMGGAWLLKLKVKHQITGEEKWLSSPLLLKP